jgi:hypothetical protein
MQRMVAALRRTALRRSLAVPMLVTIVQEVRGQVHYDYKKMNLTPFSRSR